MLKIQFLFAGAELNLRGRILDEIEKNSFITFPGKWGHNRLMHLKLCVQIQEGLVSFPAKIQAQVCWLKISVSQGLKEESEKAGLKLNVQKTKIMASSPIASWQIEGETMETVTDFIFLGSKITADGDCSHKI